MKKLIILTLGAVSVFGAKAQHSHTKMDTGVDSMSYAVGLNIASSLISGGIDTLNMNLFMEALKDVMVYNHANMDGQTANNVINEYVTKAQAEKTKLATAEGEAFLQANAAKPGVKVTPSGLQYKVIKAGTGAVPIDGQQVTTHYSGTLINGKKFDSSYDRGEPATFGVNQVIKGWTEALKMMPVGSKWELYIPYDLAYGERAVGANIPAYSTLIFTIELLAIAQ
jgi:FKBP-type peptidyl-prolyl cis-trans isomerase FklB